MELYNTLGKQTRLIPDNEMQNVVNNTCNFYKPVTTPAEILTLIYAKGGNKPPVIIFHEDGGHGWLQVPHALIDAAGIKSKISSYSYKDQSNGFLEEDCDMSLFLNAIGIMPGTELNKEFWKHCPKEYYDCFPRSNKKRY